MLRLLNNKMFRRLIVSYVILLSISILALTVSMNQLFTSVITKDFHEYRANQLRQKEWEFLSLIQTIENISYELSNSVEVGNFLSEHSENQKIDEYVLRLKLTRIQSLYPFIHSIELIEREHYQNSTDVTADVLDQLLRQARELVSQFQESEEPAFRRNIPNGEASESTVLSFITNFYNHHELYVIINIKYEAVIDRLGGISSEDDLTLLLNGQNELLAQSCPDVADPLILRRAADGEFLPEGEAGMDGYILNAHRVQGNGWYMVNLVRSSFLFSKTNEGTAFFLFLSALILLLGITAAAVLSKRIYMPLYNLLGKIRPQAKPDRRVPIDEAQVILNEITALKSQMEYADRVIYKTQDITNQNLLQRILQGRCGFDTIEMLKLSDRLSYLSEKPLFVRLLLIQVWDFEQLLEAFHYDDEELFHYGISNIIMELLPDAYSPQPIVVSQARIAVLLSNRENDFSLLARPLLEQIDESIFHYISCHAAVCLSDPGEALSSVAGLYGTCLQYAGLFFQFGETAIIDSEAFQRNAQLSHPVQFPYGQKILRPLFSYEKNSDFIANVDQFIQELSRCSLPEARTAVAAFTETLKKEMVMKIDLMGFSQEEIDSLAAGLAGSRTLSAFTVQLLELFGMIKNAQKEQSRCGNKHESLPENVRRYVEEHYADDSLSVSKIAEEFGISPGYLGKVFAAEAKVSLVQHINIVRIGHAKRLLLETDLTVKAVGEQVGILNAAYFATLFKTVTGVTPSIYRNNHASSG